MWLAFKQVGGFLGAIVGNNNDVSARIVIDEGRQAGFFKLVACNNCHGQHDAAEDDHFAVVVCIRCHHFFLLEFLISFFICDPMIRETNPAHIEQTDDSSCFESWINFTRRWDEFAYIERWR
jgi:hypothetical protein